MSVNVDVNIDAVKAAEDVVKAAQALVASANRSVVVEVDNQLSSRLTYLSSYHDHGGFGSILPKDVEPMSPNVFTSATTGFLTGTEGHAVYQFNNRKLFIHWDNPFVGSNSGDARVEPADPSYRVITITGSGSHSLTRFVVAEAAAEALNNPKDGTLVKEASHPEVYIVEGGAKFYIPSWDQLTAMGLDPTAIQVIPDGSLTRFGVVPRDGTLLKELSRNEVYLIRGGKKVHVPNPDEFNRAGLDWSAIRIVPDDSTSSLPTADW